MAETGSAPACNVGERAMSEAQPSIPLAKCLRCGATMRLSTIEPDLKAGHSERLLECQCGFVYHQSERAPTSTQTPRQPSPLLDVAPQTAAPLRRRASPRGEARPSTQAPAESPTVDLADRPAHASLARDADRHHVRASGPAQVADHLALASDPALGAVRHHVGHLGPVERLLDPACNFPFSDRR